MAFEGTPVQGLQLMGIYETYCLDFKNIIILSMNEGIFPGGKALQTYIPNEIRKEFLSTYQDREAMQAYLFYRLLQRAENVFLLYNTEGGEMGGGEKSRLILQIEQELTTSNPQALVQNLIYAVAPPPAPLEDEINIEKSEGVITKLLGLLTEHGISPSAINSYINCSLQYYFPLRYRPARTG